MTRGLVLSAAVLSLAACHRSAPAAGASATAAVAAAPAAGGHHAQAARGFDDGERPQQRGGNIEVVVNGKPVGTWTADQIAAAKAIAMTNQNGDERKGWVVKALARSLLGDKARVVALDTDDDRVTIDEKAWNDPARTLVLHLSHRGEYKAHWVQGGVADDALVKGVRRIEVVQ
jgi:hypothetical protein